MLFRSPLLQKEFIKEFRALCGPHWQIVVETSLNVPFETIQEMNPFLDGYIVDIKDMNPEIYLAYTGKENPLVLKTLEWILQHNDPERIKVRVPQIPELNTDEDVAKSVERLKVMGVVDIDEFLYIIR